ncbi:MAG: sugar MFS transporter [Bacteroidales bacterium]|jgi:glucose/galactose transporter|nr:sugar MFS transporter [Bacteroidales bacterium]
MGKQRKTNSGIYIIGALFFIFGFVTWLNNILIPFLKTACELTDFQASFVPFAFYISYFVMAVPSSFILKKSGFGNGMALGLVVMAIGSILFVPAALNRNYVLFLTGLFVQGVGLSLLQTASNPYVMILGPIESAAQRISIMGICNKIAGMIGILTLFSVLFGNTEGLTEAIKTCTDPAQKELLLQSLANRVVLPYIIMTLILIVLVLFIRAAKLPEVTEEESADPQHSAVHRSVFSYPYLWLGAMAIFFYVGAEVIAIDFLVNYGDFYGINIAISKNFGVFALIALITGYFLGIVTVPRFLSQRQALIVQLFVAMVLITVALCTQGLISIMAIIMLSFAHAIMWPAIWPLSIHNLGKHTKTGSALLIMAIAGGAILSLVYGKLSDIYNPQKAYALLFVSYAYILFFALSGYKKEKNHNSLKITNY